MRNLKLIIAREYKARVRNKTFVVMTFLSPVILVGMILLIAYLSNLSGDEQKIVGIHDISGIFSEEFHNSPDVHFEDLSLLSLENAKDLVREKEYYGLLHIPALLGNEPGDLQFYAKEAPAFGFLVQIEKTIEEKLTSRELKARGIDMAVINSAQANVNIQISNFSGERTSKMSNYVKMFFGGAAGYLLMMFIIIYGNMVMRSVIEEKTNRIIEIIISSVKPIHLMLGKILGTSLAGITQFAIWVVLGAVLLFVLTAVTGIDIANIETPQQQAMDQFSPDFLQELTLDIIKLPLFTMLVTFIL